MFKYLGGACAVALLCGALFMTGGCGAAEKKELVVGKDIAMTEIKDFYYTINSSTNPPEFQRYRFTNKDGKYSFYHEKREGNHWPLKEKDITVSGTVELNAGQWQEFAGYIKDGEVTKRTDNATSGGKGPWLYLYWSKDKGTHQVFNFADYGKRQGFEKLCLQLKDKK